jgi:hypothetical protein
MFSFPNTEFAGLKDGKVKKKWWPRTNNNNNNKRAAKTRKMSHTLLANK